MLDNLMYVSEYTNELLMALLVVVMIVAGFAVATFLNQGGR